jgi:tetraacyldisaccharide 4'-kinase
MSDRPTGLPSIITRPMSWIYGLGAAHKARGFDAGRGVVQLDRLVISIGNLSAGGTGKTPMVHAVIRALIEAGHHPVIAMRGYMAEKGAIGDEAMEHRIMFPKIPLVVQPDRTAGLKALFEADEGREVDCVVLDDGFQHRKIARDLDIVLIDASRPPDRDALLPHGFLREPVSALKRGNVFILTHTEMVSDAERKRVSEWVTQETGHQVFASARHEWERLDVHHAEDEQQRDPAWLSDKRLFILAGIGNPSAVVEAAEQLGGHVVETVVLNDHQGCTPEHIGKIAESASSGQIDVLLTTRKDWVKMDKYKRQIDCPVAIPRLKLGFGDADSELRDLLVQAVSQNPTTG